MPCITMWKFYTSPHMTKWNNFFWSWIIMRWLSWEVEACTLLKRWLSSFLCAGASFLTHLKPHSWSSVLLFQQKPWSLSFLYWVDQKVRPALGKTKLHFSFSPRTLMNSVFTNWMNFLAIPIFLQRLLNQSTKLFWSYNLPFPEPGWRNL